MTRRAKIIATLGPASSSSEAIAALLEAGVDVVRQNLSHGNHEQHRGLLHRVREVAGEMGLHVPVIMDLMGPRYRLGQLEEGGRVLERDQRVSLGPEGSSADLPLSDPELLAHLHPGERILIDNGLVELTIEAEEEDRLIARVVTGGRVSTRKGINIPDSSPPFVISQKDRADIELAVAEGADYVAASYVGSAADLEAVRRAIREAGGNLPLVAKLERDSAVRHLEEIAEAADAIMVARGDLGVEVPLHRVPVLQKRIIDAGRRVGKPIIIATQMLESMMERTRPSRAESSDVANAVFDGADALMLSGETAVGKHPVLSVETMARIIQEAEAYSRENARARRNQGQLPEPTTVQAGAAELESDTALGAFEIADVISGAAVLSSRRLGVRQIVAFSQGGFTSRMIARYRPSASIFVFTTDSRVARRSQLLWGVRPQVVDSEVRHHDEVVRLVDRTLRSRGLAESGDCIIILMGDPIPERPLTNLLRIHRIRDE